jgi:hypothetical protein
MRVLIGLFTMLFLVAGCSSLKGPNQEYTMVAVKGRVMDSETGQPVEGARVVRQVGARSEYDPRRMKGAEVLTLPSPAVTSASGHFRLPSQKGASLLFQQSSITLFRLNVNHSDYKSFSTNIDLIKIRPYKTARGPEVDVMDLGLEPRK